MTLIAAWLDWTNQRTPRLLTFADSRISNTASGGPITDHSAKLFRIPLALHRVEDVNVFDGTFEWPYFETAIGLGYAGDVVFANTIISYLTQTLPNLTIDATEEVRISWDEVVGHIKSVIEAIRPSFVPLVEMHTTFLVFAHLGGGYKISQISVSHAGDVEEQPVDIYDERCVSIGSGGGDFNSRVAAAAPELRSQLSVARHRFEKSDDATRDDREVELALLRQQSSRHMRTVFEDTLNGGGVQSVGGSVQFMEVTESFVAIRKTGDTLLGSMGAERAGRFQVLLVTER